jgi:hypothetical protein
VADDAAGESRGDVVRVVKDMGITHAEFFRTVSSLLEGEDAELREDGVTLTRGPGRIEIRLGPEGTRSLGRFHLPRTAVELVFRNCSPADVAAFVERFDTRFRRGGG